MYVYWEIEATFEVEITVEDSNVLAPRCTRTLTLATGMTGHMGLAIWRSQFESKLS